MGAIAIAIWMVAVLPVAIFVAGLGGSLALDRTFERLNRPAEEAPGEISESED